MDKMRTTEKSYGGNVVLFDGLSVPQEDVYKNSYLSYQQSWSNSKFLMSYENEFNKFLTANKKSLLRGQSEMKFDKCLYPSLSFEEEIINSFTGSTSSSNTKPFALGKKSSEDLTGVELIDHPVPPLLASFEGTYESTMGSTSKVSQISGTNITEEAYFCKIDPSNLLLSDIDYLRVKCRWYCKNVSDYALNPKELERVRYLDMFTQCFSLRNDDNDYSYSEKDEFIMENNFSNIEDEDDSYVYPKNETSKNDKVINNIDVNILNKEENSVTKKENIDVQYENKNVNNKFFTEFQNPTLSLNEKKSWTFVKSCNFEIKNSVDQGENIKPNQNSNSHKNLSPHTRIFKQFLSNGCDKTDSIPPSTNCYTPNKKSRSFLTNTRDIDENYDKKLFSSEENCSKDTNLCSSSVVFEKNNDLMNKNSRRVHYKTNNFDTNKRIGSEKSKDYSVNNTFKEESKIKEEDYIPMNNLENRYIQNSSSDLITFSDKEKNIESSKSESDSSSTKVSLTVENLKDDCDSTLSIHVNDTIEDLSYNHVESRQGVKDMFHNVESLADKTMDYDSQVKVDDEPFHAGYCYKKKSKSEIMSKSRSSNSENHDNTDQEEFENSDFSEIASSLDSESERKCEEFINKYFVNELYSQFLNLNCKESGDMPITFSYKNKKSFSGNSEMNKVPLNTENNISALQESETSNVDQLKNSSQVPRNNPSKDNLNLNDTSKPIVIVDYRSINTNPCNKVENLCCRGREGENFHNRKFSEVFWDSDSSGSESKLSIIKEDSDSTDSKSCQIKLKIVTSADSFSKVNEKYHRDVKMKENLMYKVDSESSNNFKRRNKKMFEHSYSDTSIPLVKNKKTQKLKKRKMKKLQSGDFRKSKENVTNSTVKRVNREKKRHKKNEKYTGKFNNINAGPEAHANCWKRYCTIL